MASSSPSDDPFGPGPPLYIRVCENMKVRLASSSSSSVSVSPRVSDEETASPDGLETYYPGLI